VYSVSAVKLFPVVQHDLIILEVLNWAVKDYKILEYNFVYATNMLYLQCHKENGLFIGNSTFDRW
jgi:hypothetical protein